MREREWTGMDGNGREWTGMDGNGREWTGGTGGTGGTGEDVFGACSRVNIPIGPPSKTRPTQVKNIPRRFAAPPSKGDFPAEFLLQCIAEPQVGELDLSLCFTFCGRRGNWGFLSFRQEERLGTGLLGRKISGEFFSRLLQRVVEVDQHPALPSFRNGCNHLMGK